VFAFWQFGIDDIEHQNELAAGASVQALQPGEETVGRRSAVAPPAVGHGADHVVSIHDHDRRAGRSHRTHPQPAGQ
jgi:hypothetical protein